MEGMAQYTKCPLEKGERHAGLKHLRKHLKSFSDDTDNQAKTSMTVHGKE